MKEIDMLHGSIWNKIPLFALHVAMTAILEQLFNAGYCGCCNFIINGNDSCSCGRERIVLL